MPIYEITLKGWDVDRPLTDTLIKWLSVPNKEGLWKFISNNNLTDLLKDEPVQFSKGRGNYYTEKDGVDLFLDERGCAVDPNVNVAGIVSKWKRQMQKMFKK